MQVGGFVWGNGIKKGFLLDSTYSFAASSSDFTRVRMSFLSLLVTRTSPPELRESEYGTEVK